MSFVCLSLCFVFYLPSILASRTPGIQSSEATDSTGREEDAEGSGEVRERDEEAGQVKKVDRGGVKEKLKLWKGAEREMRRLGRVKKGRLMEEVLE